MEWFYVDAGQQAGPVNETQLEELVRAGKILPDTLIWREGMASWEPYSKVKAAVPAGAMPAAPILSASSPDAPPQDAVCGECGRMFAIKDMIRHKGTYICAACKPVFMQKLSEGMSGGWQAGGFGTTTQEEVIARDYEHDLGGYMSRAWETFKNNAGIMIGASVLVYLCIIAANMVPYLSTILSIVFTGPLMGGLWIFYLKKVRGLEAGIGDAFGGFGPRFGQLILAHLVPGVLAWLCLVPMGIVALIGFLMFSQNQGGVTDSGAGVALIVVGGLLALVGLGGMLYFSTCWTFALPLVVDKGMGFWPAMSLSRKVVIKHWWMTLLIVMVVGVVAMVGVFALCVGVLVSAPVAFATLACAYDKLFGDMTPEA